MTTTTTLYATRDFKDAGTGKAFAAGDPIKDVTDGELGNYQAAGLASADTPKADPAETKGATKGA